MASTGAVLYVRPRALGATGVARSSGGVMHVSLRSLSGQWNVSGVSASADTRNSLTPLPSPRQPIGWINLNGKRIPVEIDPTWWNYNRTVWDQKLGGLAGATVPDVAATVQTTQETAAVASAQAAASSQQVIANAASLQSTVEVLRTNSIPGSAQIPNPKLAPDEWPI